MKKILSCIPKWCYIVVITVMVTVFIVTLDKSTIENKSVEKTQFVFESNNEYDLEFEYNDIDSAEEATYDKYKSVEAVEKIMNQKIFVRIKNFKSDTIKDESTSTTKVYRAIAVDQYGNEWEVVSEDDYYLSSTQNNKKIYGLYRGLSEKKLPIIELYCSYVDLKCLNKEELNEIANRYVTTLHSKYSKERFDFYKYEEGPSDVSLVYENGNKELQLTIFVDIEKKLIDEVSVYITKNSVEVDDVDKDFWYAVIMSFDSNLSLEDANNMFTTAEVMDMIDKKETIFDGFKYKNNEISVNLKLRDMIIWKS